MSDGTQRECLIDVSRLVWRSWRSRPATGIDRVCLAYLERFGPRSQAVVQRGGRIFVLSPDWSDRLRRVLLRRSGTGKIEILRALAPALVSAARSPPRRGMTYLNVGHTGLDERALPIWISTNKVRAIYLIHDIIPVTHPEYCREGEGAKHEIRMLNALASASGVIANSRHTLEELGQFASTRGIQMPNSFVAWLGIERMRVPAPHEGRVRPYFVAVGTIEGRKNHVLLLNVWDRLVSSMGEHAPELVIVGSRGWRADRAFKRLDKPGPLRGHVREINACTDDELAGMVARARALLMPSFIEGFGLPVMEALSLGTCVIASDLPVFREIAGTIPLYLDPSDEVAWEDAVRLYAGDDRERGPRLQRAAAYRPPTWPHHFAKVEDWLRSLDLLGSHDGDAIHA